MKPTIRKSNHFLRRENPGNIGIESLKDVVSTLTQTLSAFSA